MISLSGVQVGAGRWGHHTRLSMDFLNMSSVYLLRTLNPFNTLFAYIPISHCLFILLARPSPSFKYLNCSSHPLIGLLQQPHVRSPQRNQYNRTFFTQFLAKLGMMQKSLIG
ncbi:hypothetical protein Ac2012v2_007208 [Leucoagaricus gongylophorus]